MLFRSANLFSARNFNIESLSVAPTNNPSSSIMTIVTSGNDHVIEQIIKQLSKIIDVLDVVDITSSDHIEKQVLLIKLDSNEYQKIKGKDFKKTVCKHPFFDLGYDYDIPMLEANFVTTEQGTGIVHCAPSHGPDDFNLCLNNGIKAIETVDEIGRAHV